MKTKPDSVAAEVTSQTPARAKILDHVLFAERRVLEVQGRVEHQREQVAQLASDDRSEKAAKAVSFLKELEEERALYVTDRNRLTRELAKASD